MSLNINYRNLDAIEGSERRCDQCTKKHQQCDKKTPTCSRCLRLNMICTWNRPILKQSLKRYDNLDRFYCNGKRPSCQNKISKKGVILSYIDRRTTNSNSVSNFNPTQPNSNIKFNINNIKKPISKNSNSRNFQYYCNNINGVDSKLSVVNPWILILRNQSTKIATRTEFIYFSRLAGISVYDANTKDHLFLAQFVLAKKPTNFFKPQLVKQVVLPFIIRSQLLSLATDGYFYYYNPFYPLFTRYSYESRPRSELLMLSVWRIGLQFLNSSPFKTSMIEELDKKIMRLIQPSNLVWSLDTLQAITALVNGIYEPPLIQSVIALFGMATTMVYCLGLHMHCYPIYKHNNYDELILFERQLLLAQINQADGICFSRSGEFRLAPLDDERYMLPNPSSCLSGWFHSHYTDSILLYRDYFTFIDRLSRNGRPFMKSCMNPRINPNYSEQLNNPCDSNSYVNLLEIPNCFPSCTSTSAIMDFCILIVSLCSNQFINTFKDIQELFNSTIATNSSAVDLRLAIQKAEQSLYKTFKNGLLHLHCAKLVSSNDGYTSNNNTFIFNTSPFFMKSNLFEIFNCPSENLVMVQMQLLLSLRFNFFMLLVIEAGTHIDPTSPHYLSSKPNSTSPTSLSFKGICSAINLIKLLSLVGRGPFCIMKDFFLMTASRFIITHFHAYHLPPTSPTTPSPNTTTIGGSPIATTLIQTLSLSREILIWSCGNTVGDYYINSNLILLDNLLHRSMIPISTSSQHHYLS